MAQTCSKCSRVNPPEAVYCFFDGNHLSGHARAGGQVSVGTQPFLTPFVFPSGRQCRNFDELALASQQQWSAARDLLRQGYLENFFGGMGRADLALAAREAAHFPDHDRGLDQLLAKLPSHVLEAPKLRAEPPELNLGIVPLGQDRTFELHLHNQGMRLLYGSITVEDAPWLTLGDAPGATEKLFQIGTELAIPVHVRGKQLRAGVRPIEGRLAIESNGGTMSVVVRVEVPVRPYPDGPLAGARTPREVAQKAKAVVDKSRTGDKKESAEVAAHFERGKVAQWYKTNGWIYPVQGPSASGLGAVQQFFEALGLTPPPKVQINRTSVDFQGAVGDPLKTGLEVSSPEKRPVYAHGISDQPWLEVGRAKLNGRTATIPIVVPTVPNRPGETLSANVTITSNGNQRFVVPVKLTVGGHFNFAAPVPVPVVAAVAEESPLVPPPKLVSAPEPLLAPPPIIKRRRATGGLRAGHFVPLLLLLCVLVGILVYDFFGQGSSSSASTSGAPTFKSGTGVAVANQDIPYPQDVDTTRLLSIEFTKGSRRFGIQMLKEHDPANPDKHKRLTYEEDGKTNNTCIRLEGQESLFGNVNPGKWLKKYEKGNEKAAHRERWTSVMDFPREKVEVTQVVELVPGQSRQLDTVLVRYTVQNKSETPRKVGLRVLLDTFIGANDGVPFRIPGRAQFMDTMEEFDFKQIPVYVQAWERPDLKDPGTVAHVGLKGIDLEGIELEPIDRMRICHWPGNSEIRWEWDMTPINQPPERKDSCVVLYWKDREMSVGEKREMAFTYGLNAISSAGKSGTVNPELGLTVGGSFRKGGEFTLSATIKNPQPGQKAKLDLPAGLELAGGQALEQDLKSGSEYTQCSWRIVSREVGKYTLDVTTGAVKESQRVQITTKGIFD